LDFCASIEAFVVRETHIKSLIMKMFRLFAFCAALLCASVAYAQSVVPQHPLDGLTAEEVAKAVLLIREQGLATDATRYPAITLLEPAKDLVLKWKSGDPLPRQAFVIMRDPGKTREARVDLASGKVEVIDKPGANPAILDEEWVRGRDAMLKDERFLTAIKKRGYESLDQVLCTPNSAGYFPSEKFDNRRMLKVPCYDSGRSLHPYIPRPIEGLMGIVDSETGEVVSVIDHDPFPPPPVTPAFTAELQAPLKPIGMVQPQGSNIIIVNNSQINWANWTMHLRPDKRAGLIVSRVTFNDGKKLRDIAYQMNVSEMFVPYMDPDTTWSYRTFIDAGEFGLGTLISPLEPDVDCPLHAQFIDMTLPNETGEAYVAPRMVCVFERATGDPAWRHYSSGARAVDGVQQVELVVRHIPTVGNYDYIIDYVFSPQGNITLRVGATGFDALKSVRASHMSDASAKQDTAFGALVAPNIVAPNHDHYINFRLDLDVDGPANTMLADEFELKTDPAAATRKSHWAIKTESVTQEGALGQAGHGTTSWRIANGNVQNALGQSPSYWIQSHGHATSMLDPTDAPQLRAQFSASSLWVTHHREGELWAAGTYANVSQTDTGLPAFARDQDNIINQDLVVWHTMGFRHATRPEDFPILPTFWHETTLRPAFFFDKDPSSGFNPGSLGEQ
jgi:primary-amine oxidase